MLGWLVNFQRNRDALPFSEELPLGLLWVRSSLVVCNRIRNLV